MTIDWLGRTATYYYDEAGRLTDLNHLNGTCTSYNYDNANRLTDFQNRKSDTSAIATYHFTLDDNGNRTGIDRIEPLIPLINIDTIDHTYNAEKNRLLTAGASSFTYDLEGQLADIDGTPYTFDDQHRLASIDGATPCQYSYNGAGNRLETIRDGVTTRYIYDASGNLLTEADEHNNITRYYIHGLGLLAMVAPSDEVYCYHFNATGSTIAMTDGGQEVVNKYAYTPFGIITNQQEAVPQPFKYVGQHGVMTEPNGLQYMRARYYDPQVGRFISEDPLEFGGGDVNLYAYVKNNPVMFVDPWGLCGQSSLGVYKDPSVLGFYSDNPVIYQETNQNYATGWTGILTPEHGLAATVGTGQIWEGSTSIVVYGSDNKPSSWQAATWQKTNQRGPGTGWNQYNWVILNEKSALKLSITREAIEYFNNP